VFKMMLISNLNALPKFFLQSISLIGFVGFCYCGKYDMLGF
jgi:hypothetical protein